jgi:hypothetical protein
MSKQVVARVFTRDEDHCYGPDYALIAVTGDESVLTERLSATQELAARFGGEATTPRTGPLHATDWWLSEMPLEVRWLRCDAVIDEEGEEPEWMSDLEDEGYAVVEGFVPRFGALDEFGQPENEFTSVDLQVVVLYPDGTLRVEANVDDTSLEFGTCEIPVTAFAS